MAIKVCISFLLSKDKHFPLHFPQVTECCRCFWRCDRVCLPNPLRSLGEPSAELERQGVTPFGQRRGKPVAGKTCLVQPSWVGVLTPCVMDWSDSSCDCYGKRLSKGKRLFPSHKGNNQIVSALSLPSVRQNILLI